MKVFIGIVLVVAFVSAGASATAADVEDEDDVDYETCLKEVNELMKGFSPAESISQAITKLESVMDLSKVMDLSMGKSTDTRSLRYAVTLKNPKECKPLYKEYTKMRAEHKCMGNLVWTHDGPRDKLMEGDFGTYLRAIFSCYITQNIEFADI